MTDWIVNNLSTILVLAAVVLAVFFVIRGMIRERRSGACSCGGNCGSCGCCGSCGTRTGDTKQ